MTLVISATISAFIELEPNWHTLLLSRGAAIILCLHYVFKLFRLGSMPDFWRLEEQEYHMREPIQFYRHSTTQRRVSFLLSAIIVMVCTTYLVNSANAISEMEHISKTFIGFVLLAMIGSTEELRTTIPNYRYTIGLGLDAATGSSIQITLLGLLISVLLGWLTGKEMTLNFEVPQLVVPFLSVVLVYCLVGDGKNIYLTGMMCIRT